MAEPNRSARPFVPGADNEYPKKTKGAGVPLDETPRSPQPDSPFEGGTIPRSSTPSGCGGWGSENGAQEKDGSGPQVDFPKPPPSANDPAAREKAREKVRAESHKKSTCKKWTRRAAAGLAALLLALTAGGASAGARLPARYRSAQPGGFSLGGNPLFSVAPVRSAHAASANGETESELRLLGCVPVKPVQVEQVTRTTVQLGGTPFGLKLYADGALVVSIADVDTAAGRISPAQTAGLCVGDVIRAIDGHKVAGNADAQEKFSRSGGRALRLTVDRDGKLCEFTLTPAFSQSCGGYRAGLWVKDSCAGIGTLTFVTADGVCAGLGHGITEPDTGALMPLQYGELVPVALMGVTRGTRGTPGELRGYFAEGSLGSLCRNTACGVFGRAAAAVSGERVEVAMRQEVHRGAARVYTTVGDSGPSWYDVKIERICYDESAQTQNMVVCIADPALRAATGGIVQGMSGSPIVQDGRLVGAITHVFVNDPTRGYAIFAEIMLAEAQKTAA